MQNKVLELIASATDIDGIPPVAEHVLLHLRHGGDKSDFHLIAMKDNQLTGYAHLDLTDQVEGPSAELVIAPKFRNQGIGKELVKELKAQAGGKLRLWSHGDLPGAKNIAAANGFTHTRTVIQMRRSLTDSIPDIDNQIPIRTFLPTIDNEEWIKVNNLAFADHPEQSDWTLADLELRTKEDWFDPKGFLIADINNEIAGFCWTKIHGGQIHKHSESEAEHDHDPIGEIYIMGVSPKFEGKGIGRAVTIAGLNYLKSKGLASTILYVDSDNIRARNLYEAFGFKVFNYDLLYELVN